MAAFTDATWGPAMFRAVVFATSLGGLLACGDAGPGAPDACNCGEPDAARAADAGASADAATAVGWHPLAEVIDGPIQETATVAIDGKIYVIGGFDASLAVVSDLRVYDPLTDAWSTGAPLPRPLHHVNAATVGGKLYILGGLSGLAFTAVGDCFVYDPAADAWTALASMPAGTARGASFVGAVGATIYVAGGLRGTSVSELSAYDTVADAWSGLLPPLPTPRDHGAGAAVGSTLYAIGGRTGSITGVSARVDRFDTVTNSWSAGAPMITARGGTAAGVVDGKILVVGGEGNVADPAGIFDEAEAYDPIADEWVSLPAMRTPRHGMAAAGLEGKLYVPGGATQQAFGAVATHEVYVAR